MEKAILETKKLGEYALFSEISYACAVAESYGYNIKNMDFEAIEMITAIYHYGQVIGIRGERARRKAGK